jgi:hypothetical protein
MASDDNNNENHTNGRQRACRPPRNNNDNVERRPATFEEILDCELEHLTGKSSGETLYTGTECRSDDHAKCDSVYAAAVVTKAHNARLSGLAFSGGGIRSATFNLGVLQTLAKLNLLKEFHYLSTVSGGGYIGSWLAAWIHREHQNLIQCGESLEGGDQAGEHQKPNSGIDVVHNELATSACHGAQNTGRGAMQPDAPSIWHLREYSNYLTPSRGTWSTDWWTIMSAYFRNLLLTLSVLLGTVVTLVLFGQAFASGFYLLASGDFDATALFTGPYITFLIVACITSFLLGFELSPRRARTTQHAYRAFTAVILAVVCAAAGSVWLWSISDLDVSPNLVRIAVATLFLIAGTLIFGFGGRWFGNHGLFGDAPPSDVAGSWRTTAWMVAGSVLALGVLILLWRLLAQLMFNTVHNSWNVGVWFPIVWGVPLVVLTFTIAATVYVGFVGSAIEEIEREWLARFFGALVKFTLMYTGFMLLVIYSFKVVDCMPTYLESELYEDTIKPGLLVLWAALSGFGTYFAHGDTSAKQGWMKRVVLAVAPWVFIFGLIVVTIWGTTEIVYFLLKEFVVTTYDPSQAQALQYEWLDFFPFSAIISDFDTDFTKEQLLMVNGYWAVAVVLSIVVLIMTVLWSRRVGVNDFSLHSLYGNRLIRAYLGASNLKRAAHPFTGFDQTDNSVHLAELPQAEGRRYGPYPIINAAVNLVAGRRLAWQKRKAASFSFTPLFCGYEFCDENSVEATERNKRTGGYAMTEEYGGGKGRGVSLGKAMTISGAALSPNMGYYSSPALTFLMTTFNVRLGWWLPNTQKKNVSLLKLRGPRMGLLYFITEALGLTGTDKDYVYLSDGGHFENLGVYELVRRRCHFIVACDAEADPELTFSGLGNAVEKCRTDLGVPIDIDVSQIKRDAESNLSTWHCAVGCIRYSDADPDQHDGTILYIKASLTGDEPSDVAAYARDHQSFPHESTADQWFDETQFESYRALGEHISLKVLSNAVSISNRRDKKERFLSRVVLELRKQWYPHTDQHDAPAKDHNTRLEQLMEILRNDPQLAFLDSQLYPNLQRIADLYTGSPWKWLTEYKQNYEPRYPKDTTELRAAFYYCKQLLQFMTQVFHDRHLDTEYAAPSNRGWMNLFRRWSLSRMFGFTWAITAGTYSARFQSFCEYHLKLESGDPDYGDPIMLQATVNDDEKIPAVTIVAKADDKHKKENANWKERINEAGIHLFEYWLIREFITAYVYSENVKYVRPTVDFTVYPLALKVDNVFEVKKKEDEKITLNAGVAIVGPDPKEPHVEKNNALIYFRVRASMRNMDLARKAFIKIRSVDSAPAKVDLDHKLEDVRPDDFQSTLHKRAYHEVHERDRENMMRCRWFSNLMYEAELNEDDSN